MGNRKQVTLTSEEDLRESTTGSTTSPKKKRKHKKKRKFTESESLVEDEAPKKKKHKRKEKAKDEGRVRTVPVTTCQLASEDESENNEYNPTLAEPWEEEEEATAPVIDVQQTKTCEENQGTSEEDLRESTTGSTTSPKKKRKHKHEKHKKKRELTESESLVEDEAPKKKKHKRKEKAKDEGSQEEEDRLDALQAGELDDYGRMKQERDTSTMTASQRAVLGHEIESENELLELPTDDTDIDKIVGGITQKQCEEFEKLVPCSTERPTKLFLTYNPSKMYQFVILDTETTCIGRSAEICQLSAVTQTGATYSTYILPEGDVHFSATMVNNLTVKCIKGTRTLCKSYRPVNSVSLHAALESFIKFLQDQHDSSHSTSNSSITVLVGHNSTIFDVPILLRNAGILFEKQLHEMNVYFGDSLALIKSLLRRHHSPLKQSDGEYCLSKQSSVYKCLFDEGFDAHDGLKDVIALKKILFSSELAIDVETIVNSSQIHSVRDAKTDLDYMDRRHNLLQSFVTGNIYCPYEDQSPISRGMAFKIAGSGLAYNDLSTLYHNFGEVGVVGILSMPSERQRRDKVCKPRVTKTKRILKNIVKHFRSNNRGSN